ncbi:class I SAM-dependent methyltransferase [Paenibacillus sp. N3/727]|uniref:class I SAM-dependent methyltransferase n=1 Tax=Paenibacillus sp. N3/727 TaxID=2925845 RepID=UPI001F53C2C4|nr:class I SAM-dependent methyltransferase [Paenibacillus sp. N3/727]UNK20823.1 class I SAM-dependent methyltransferase [Paenibacillus sp. N3/727]
MIITTGEAEAPAFVERAKSIAEETGCRYVTRGGQSLRRLALRTGDEDVLVVLDGHVRLGGPGRSVLEFHPGMGYVRLKRVLRGDPDPMIEATRMEEGDSVLDCTAGLGADSLVFSVKAGESGSVTALESSFPLYVFLKEGLRTYESNMPASDEAMRRIDVRHGHHLDYLKTLPDKSVDIVYFDPMFREPLTESASINPLRHYANSEPLDEQSILEAIRVARKTVVLKEKRGSKEFARLGFTVPERGQSKITYGVISIDRTI